ncbi:DUF960 domain-containing protein [Streptococcus merionis]|uniref:Staphylococcal protein of uncharacterized function (DUF960) n=1 Tax=Streptococcus merionis TaxID=400065 RepID=A0A239SXY3_9STRE|nr:DUF960 domain-containing protein [Streptococcus merionis]SNU89678.1 Staphylococcal protein of uncharacterised function (DUF960) [Streptococcus merionis]
MAFSNTRGRYASFGIVTSLPSEAIDIFWEIIDNNLKGVFTLKPILKFRLSNRRGKLSITFSQDQLPMTITFDYDLPYDPFYPHSVYVVDQNGRETVTLPEEAHMI